MYLCKYISLAVHVYRSTNPSIYLSIYLSSMYLCKYPFVSLHVCLSIYLSIYLYIHTYIHTHTHMFGFMRAAIWGIPIIWRVLPWDPWVSHVGLAALFWSLGARQSISASSAARRLCCEAAWRNSQLSSPYPIRPQQNIQR